MTVCNSLQQLIEEGLSHTHDDSVIGDGDGDGPSNGDGTFIAYGSMPLSPVASRYFLRSWSRYSNTKVRFLSV